MTWLVWFEVKNFQGQTYNLGDDMKSFFYFLKFRNIRLVSVFAGLLFSSVVAYANLLTPWNFTLYINGRAENGAAVNDYYDWR